MSLGITVKVTATILAPPFSRHHSRATILAPPFSRHHSRATILAPDRRGRFSKLRKVKPSSCTAVFGRANCQSNEDKFLSGNRVGLLAGHKVQPCRPKFLRGSRVLHLGDACCQPCVDNFQSAKAKIQTRNHKFHLWSPNFLPGSAKFLPFSLIFSKLRKIWFGNCEIPEPRKNRPAMVAVRKDFAYLVWFVAQLSSLVFVPNHQLLTPNS